MRIIHSTASTTDRASRVLPSATVFFLVVVILPVVIFLPCSAALISALDLHFGGDGKEDPQ